LKQVSSSVQETQLQLNSCKKELLEQEPALALLSFDADTAWDIGYTLRGLAAEKHPGRPVCISIIQTSTNKPMFFTRTAGVTPSQMSRLEGIQNKVKLLEMSTWRAGHDFGGSEEPTGPGQCYPGGWPVRVRQVEGVVAVLVVHGLGYKLTRDGSIETTVVHHISTDGWAYGPSQVQTASLDHELIIDALKIVLNQQ
jgi:uncharacterized protein (UPF0303 family)